MAIKTFRPTTPTRRYQTVNRSEDISRSRPYKPLVEPLKKSGGRRTQGDLTIWHRGGGHKRQYRRIDFKRDKAGIPAVVESIEYDPNRSARIALLKYRDGERRYILQPAGLKVGAVVSSGPGADIVTGNALALKIITSMRTVSLTIWMRL